MTNVVETREELAKVVSLVLTARRLLAGGTLVDLSAIEERVETVCRAVETMPSEDGKALIEDLQALIHKLDQLESDLKGRLEPFSAAPDSNLDGAGRGKD